MWPVRIVATCLCVVCFGYLEGHGKVIGPIRPIVATPGDDVLLKCHLEPKSDIYNLTVDWIRTDLSPPIIVYSHRHRNEYPSEDPIYKGKVEMFPEALRVGNFSLLIKNVTLDHQGQYRCLISKLNNDVNHAFLRLIVEKRKNPDPNYGNTTVAPQQRNPHLPIPDPSFGKEYLWYRACPLIVPVLILVVIYKCRKKRSVEII